MPRFQRRTLRLMSPLQREIAEIVNDLDGAQRHLLRLLDRAREAELKAKALDHLFPGQEIGTIVNEAPRNRPVKNQGRFSLDELEEDFHATTPLERRVLGS